MLWVVRNYFHLWLNSKTMEKSNFFPHCASLFFFLIPCVFSLPNFINNFGGLLLNDIKIIMKNNMGNERKLLFNWNCNFISKNHLIFIRPHCDFPIADTHLLTLRGLSSFSFLFLCANPLFSFVVMMKMILMKTFLCANLCSAFESSKIEFAEWKSAEDEKKLSKIEFFLPLQCCREGEIRYLNRFSS